MCSAQRDRGTLTGIVTDNSGAVVPNVQVIVKNTATNVISKTMTNEVGQYTQPNLPIGPYQITFEAEGFKTLVRSNLDLAVGVLRVDVKLEVGRVTGVRSGNRGSGAARDGHAAGGRRPWAGSTCATCR